MRNFFKDWDINIDLPVEEENNSTPQEQEISMNDKYVVPPFSILDARKGYWQDRKKTWRKMIGDNCESRENLLKGFENLSGRYGMEVRGTSLLDPVLSEIICKWFGITNGNAFDTFAGDTVFGFVSSSLGMTFTGIELREEQAKLNNQRVCGMNARYICDDGQNVLEHIELNSQDLFFSCPPYYDLEVYSDKENDASNQSTYEDFLKIIETAFVGAISCLKEDRFAVVVCGDIRDKKGEYRRFPDDIKNIFCNNGCVLYNELVLVDPIGSAIYRANTAMKNRKVIKVHQNVLVFYKGDIDNIKNNFKPIEYAGKDLEQFGLVCED